MAAETSGEARVRHLAQYFYSLRIQRGYETVAEYLRFYSLPISEAYYRALESGTKTGREVGIETALRLCDALDADEEQFFLHLLRDLLPVELFERLVRPIPLRSFKSVAEHQADLEHDVQIYRQAMAQARMAESYFPSLEAVDHLAKNTSLLSYIHFIYLSESCTFSELKAFQQAAKLEDDLADVITVFKALDLIELTEAEAPSGPRVRKKRALFRVPHSPSGQTLKDLFLAQEIQRSFTSERAALPFQAGTNSFIESFVAAYSANAHEGLRRRVLDVLAELAAHSEDAEPSNAEPYFVALVFSPRPEYVKATSNLGE